MGVQLKNELQRQFNLESNKPRRGGLDLQCHCMTSGKLLILISSHNPKHPTLCVIRMRKFVWKGDKLIFISSITYWQVTPFHPWRSKLHLATGYKTYCWRRPTKTTLRRNSRSRREAVEGFMVAVVAVLNVVVCDCSDLVWMLCKIKLWSLVTLSVLKISLYLQVEIIKAEVVIFYAHTHCPCTLLKTQFLSSFQNIPKLLSFLTSCCIRHWNHSPYLHFCHLEG